jgi:D-tagatose-bisphosphate aldolase class II non-catalytic subunit
MTRVQLHELASRARSKYPSGITSVCSAHPIVLRAAIRFGKANNNTILIESTCNQVNHLGGYTGMKPADFAGLVYEIAVEEECPHELIILGGDHLGPNPWRHKSADEAMAEAENMVRAYVAAGFRKIHLDASMGCLGESIALDDETTAKRAAQLTKVAEEVARQSSDPVLVYIIGTEVPTPGGADHVLSDIEPTSADAARKTLVIHRRVFQEAGLSDAFSRAIALVVQPGVEFGNHNVIQYDRSKTRGLINLLKEEPQFVFEAHSTDYQGTQMLRELVEDGFSILKVGPELTFVMREALYALDHIATTVVENYGERALFRTMESAMLKESGNWNRHYTGSLHEQMLLRHFSLSDRMRYYWAAPDVVMAVKRLFDTLRGVSIPRPLMSQYLPSALSLAHQQVDPEDLVISHVTRTISAYHTACVPVTEK